MFSKLNPQYQLAHNPLVWNTRIIQVLIVNFVIHLLFFLSGFGSISSRELGNLYYSISDPASLHIFSTLCSILVLIVWLVFFLRNNAYKSFYRIGKWYLAKEFLAMLLIVFSSLVYYESFYFGKAVKIRTLISESQFVREINTINQAIAFIPLNKADYFVLNSCSEKNNKHPAYNENFNYTDTSSFYFKDSGSAVIRRALQRPDAFSYKNYCQLLLKESGRNGVKSGGQLAATNIRWLENRAQDSVKFLLSEFKDICSKYGIRVNIDIAELSKAPFASPRHTIPYYVSNNEYNGSQTAIHYVNIYDLNSTIDNILTNLDRGISLDLIDELLVEGYVALGIAIFILCYRRFNRRIFLISIVGTLVWAIFIGLITASAGSVTGFAVFCMLLCLAFLFVALASLRSQDSKRLTGILLNWHIYLAPYFVLFVMMIVLDRHTEIDYLNETDMRNRYPFVFWVEEHRKEISIVNLMAMILYVTIVFNRWTKKWHVMPEE